MRYVKSGTQEKIFEALPGTVGEIARVTGLNRTRVSSALTLLREAGRIDRTGEINHAGTWVVVIAESRAVRDARVGAVVAGYCARWEHLRITYRWWDLYEVWRTRGGQCYAQITPGMRAATVHEMD